MQQVLAPALEARGIRKSFSNAAQVTTVLHGVDLTVEDGEFVCVMGPSGSGKSTLLYCISGMDEFGDGTVAIGGESLVGLSADELAVLRRSRIGFVFQQPNLIARLNLMDNISLAHRLGDGGTAAQVDERARGLMHKVGIAELEGRTSDQFSGGQAQRAGICRALMGSPTILFADEPTGALNSAMADEVLETLMALNREGMSMLLVTHDSRVAARSDRVVILRDGSVVHEERLGPFSGDADELTVRAQRVSEVMANAEA